MSIKSDRWIRRMAREHGMIEPFVEGQVRELDRQGRRVISYGVSSYGYDMRVAPEFKIFTNALSAVVTPRRSTRAHSWNTTARSASCRPTASPWRVRWNISGFPAMC